MGERWRWVLPYLIVGGLWGVVSIWLPSGGSGYVEQAGAISARTILDNLAANALLPGTFWGMQAVFSPLNILVMVISGPVALYGAWQNAVKRASGGKDRLFFLYTGLTLGLYTIVPFFQGLRFLFPALPFYVYFFFKGISALTARFLSPARARGLSTAVLTGLALVLLVQSIGLATRSRQNLIRVEGPFDRLSKQMFRAINNDTAPDSVIIFFKPRVLHLLTGREAFFSMDCADLQIANYLIEHKDQPLMQLARCSQAFDLEPVFENARFVIYRVSSR